MNTKFIINRQTNILNVINTLYIKYRSDEKIQLDLPIQEKTVWDYNSEHTLFCLVLKRPLKQMSSAKQNNRDFSGNDVIDKIHSHVLGHNSLSLSDVTVTLLDSFGGKSLRTKTISNKDHSYKGDHFVQKLRSHFVQGFYCTRWYLNFYIHMPRNHFIQRPFRTKTQESNFLFEFLDWVRVFFQHMALIWYNIVFVYFYNDYENKPQRLFA